MALHLDRLARELGRDSLKLGLCAAFVEPSVAVTSHPFCRIGAASVGLSDITFSQRRVVLATQATHNAAILILQASHILKRV